MVAGDPVPAVFRGPTTQPPPTLLAEVNEIVLIFFCSNRLFKVHTDLRLWQIFGPQPQISKISRFFFLTVGLMTF